MSATRVTWKSIYLLNTSLYYYDYDYDEVQGKSTAYIPGLEQSSYKNRSIY